jgi:Skp family chaperone for outer membrane proteins
MKQHKKIAVADAVKLFDQFNMKKEMEAKAKIKLDILNQRADSVNGQLQIARASRDEKAVEKLSYAYSYFRSQLEEEYARSNKDINEQVWKRLNPAVEEFGKRSGVHVIIGANGMGSVLYNDDHYDITAQLIAFVNHKYEGGE